MLVVGVGSLVCGASTAQALSLSPAIIETQMNPGETRTVPLSVTNDETVPIQLYASLQKFLPLGTQGQQRFLPPEDIEGLPSWTFVSVENTPLKPGETRVIPIQFRVPLDARQGGAYEAIFLSTQPPKGLTNQKNIGIRSRIGALVLLSVGDIGKTELQVTDWHLEEPLQSHVLGGSVRVTLQNNGRTHVHPKGALVIRNAFGREVERVALNADMGRVLPASERTFDVKFGVEHRTGGIINLLLDELRGFGMGTYTISLELTEGVSTPPAVLRISIWSWHVLIPPFMLLVTLFVLFRLYRARLIRSWQSRT